MKALGALIKEFYENGFPCEYYHDDYDEALFPDEGDVQFAFDDNDMVDLDACGSLFPHSCEGDPIRFETAFKKWHKAQTTAILVVECPVTKRAEMMAAIQAAGGKVRR